LLFELIYAHTYPGRHMVVSNSAVAPLGVHYSKVDGFYLRPFFLA